MSNAQGEHTMTNTDTRLEELEREVRGLRRSARRQRLVAGGIGAVLLAALALGGAGQPGDAGKVVDELRVKRLSIIDDQGKVRISARTNPEGDAAVSWFDRDGKPRIDASTSLDGRAGVDWWDRDGKARIRAATYKDGTAELPTRDMKQRP